MRRFQINVCLSGRKATALYRVHSFKNELIAFLEKHGIEYKEWMLD